jgi:hypothetical protein
MRLPIRRTAVIFAFCLSIPLASFAGEPQQAPAACLGAAASATSFVAFLQAADAAPAPQPAQVYTYGVCASSCNPATCHKGPLGVCQHQNCLIGVLPSACAPGDSCISLADCN